MSNDITPKQDDYKGYLSLLRSKGLTMGATVIMVGL